MGDFNILTKKKKIEKPSLFELCKEGDIDGIRNFLKHGGDLFKRSYSKKTALHAACKYNHHEIVKFLIKKGLSINAKNEFKETPLFYSFASKDILETLFKNGADLNHCDIDGRSPLHTASRLGYVDSVKFLIDNGANYLATWRADTPLHNAAERGNLEVVEFFINAGYFHSPKDISGQTPLDKTFCDSYFNVAKFLVSQGADPNQGDDTWRSSWERASINKNRKDFFQIFIEYGHMPDIKSFYDDELKELFMKFFKIPKVYLLFCAREKNVGSHFYKDSLPFDLFKEIFKSTRSFCLEHEWNTFLKNAK